jgi:mRNA interferase HigB
MRIVSKKRLKDFWSLPGRKDAKGALLEWQEDVRLALWQTPADVKATFGKRVDFVKSRRTRNTLPIFDIGGNKYRLVAAIHYVKDRPGKGRVYVLKIMTHEEYDDDRWKDEF